MAFGITDLKKGTVFQYESVPYKVVEYSQKVMGRGGSIVNVRIKSLLDGRVLEKTFKGNEQIEPADVINKNVQYLYGDTASFHFMDQDTYEQFEVSAEIVGDGAGYMKEGDTVTAQLFDGRAPSSGTPRSARAWSSRFPSSCAKTCAATPTRRCSSTWCSRSSMTRGVCTTARRISS